MKKKILQITHDLDLGGLQQVIVHLCTYINRDLFDVSVLCLREKGMFATVIENMGIRVFSLDQNLLGVDYFAFVKICRILKNECIDIVHTHNTQPFIDGGLAAVLAGVQTVIHTDHARKYPDKRSYMFAEWLLSHFVYKVIGVSDHTRLELIRYEKMSPRKVVTIPNGIDPSKLEGKIDKKALLKDLNINNRNPVIGFCGRIAEQKGLIYLLQALPAICSSFPEAVVLLAGDGPLRQDLEHRSQEMGIGDKVKFLGTRQDIPSLLKVFDVFVLPSIFEGLPMVVLEAMAAGCPVVATDVGGTSTAIDNGKTGILVGPENPGELARGITALLTDRELRNRIIAAAKESVNNNFSAKKMTQRYEQLYLRLI